MRTKILSLLSLATVIGLSAGAQALQVKAGVNFANVTISNSGRIDENKTLTSFHAGLVGDFPLGTKVVSLQPGIFFTGKGSKTQYGDESSNNYWKATTNPYYIQVPVNLVFRVPFGTDRKDGGFFVGVGPYGAIGVAGKNKIEGKSFGVAFERDNKITFSKDDPTTTNVEEGAGFGVLRRFDYGADAIVGFEGKSWVLSANYDYGLAKLQSGSGSSSNDDKNNKHRVLGISIGFKL